MLDFYFYFFYFFPCGILVLVFHVPLFLPSLLAGILHSLRVPWTARSPAWWTQVGLGAWGCEVLILQCLGVTAPAIPGKIIFYGNGQGDCSNVLFFE